MRACVLMLLAAVAGAEGDHLPREGSGWTGFRAGTWVRSKVTYINSGNVPTVNLTTKTLDKVDTKNLTFRNVTVDGLRAERKTRSVTPLHGEAGVGEKAKVEKLSDAPVFAVGRTWECTRSRSTITGPAGKRVVTVWMAKAPRFRVKRTIEFYDASGKVSQRESIVLKALEKTHWVGSQRVRALTYSTVRKMDGSEQRGTAIVSRDVPGETVRLDAQVLKDGKVMLTIRVEVLDFATK